MLWKRSIRRAVPLTILRVEQIGILFCGVTVETTIIGGPAYNSRKLHPGDVILKVDGVVATMASCPPQAKPMHNSLRKVQLG